MWYDQGTTELATDGWIIISWLVTWGCLLDFSPLAHLLAACHLCLIVSSCAPLIGIAFYRTPGSSVQSKAMSDEDTWVCVSLLSCCTLVDQIDSATFVVESQQCPALCHWFQTPGPTVSSVSTAITQPLHSVLAQSGNLRLTSHSMLYKLFNSQWTS
jgi:hypothetical protein